MSKLLRNKILLGLLVLVFGFFLASGTAQAATCTASAGDWDEVGTWSCGHVPLADDDVVIPTNVDVIIDVAGAVAGTVTLQDAAAANNSITINSPGTLTVTGAVTIAPSTGAATSTLNVNNGTLVMDGATISGGLSTGLSRILVSTGSITSTSNIAFGGAAAQTAFTASGAATITLSGTTATIGTGGTVSLNSASTVVFSGTGAQTINTYGYGNLTINKASGTATLGGNTNFAGNVLISSGTYDTSTRNTDITGTTTISSGGTLSHGTGTKVHNGNVTINSGGTWTETGAAVVSYLGHLTNNGTFTASTGVHSFDIDNRSINGTIAIPNLTINQLTTNNGVLTVSTALAGGSTLTNAANASLTIGGTSAITGLTATAAGNTVTYNAAGAQTVKAVSYYNLAFAGSGNKSVGSGITIGNQLTLSGTAVADLTGASTSPFLVLAGTTKGVGVYGSTSSSAPAANQLNTYFLSTATGTVAVTSGIITGGGGGLASEGGSSSSTTTTTTSTPSGQTTSTVAQSETPVTISVSPEVTMTTLEPGCSGGNKYNTSTGQLCVNNSGTGESVSITAAKKYALGSATLKNGSRGDAVKELQMFLNDTMNLGLAVDGKLGPKTIAVIKKWQAANGLVADGLVGPKTKAKMNGM